MRLYRLLLASGLLLAAAPALAQERRTNEFGGPYIGPHAGLSRLKLSPTVQQSSGVIATDEGWSIGGQIGQRWQSGALVTGLELEADFTDTVAVASEPPGSTSPVNREFDLKASGRLKGLIGAAYGPVLGYVTGGIQVSRIELDTSFPTTGIPPQSFEQNETALVYGFGLAYRVAPRVTVELEATRADFGDLEFAGDVGGARTTQSDALTLRLNRSF